MKAIVYKKYGPPEVLQLIEVEKPVPKDKEVLIKIYATTVSSTDAMMRRGEPYWGRIILGLRKPKRNILGFELAGIIEATGKNVKRFKKGDQVFGFTGFSLGTHAEYTCMSEKGSLLTKPINITYDEAASLVDGSTTALFFLRDKAHIRKGQKILIIGASGSMGASAIQLASYFGAEVTGVCSTGNLELVKSLGADKVVDYTKEDFTKNGQNYDFIFDTVNKSSFSHCKGSLKRNGGYLPTFGLINHFLDLWTSIIGGKKVISGMSIQKAESLKILKEIIESGHLKPVIDRKYTLEQMVEAHGYVDKGHKKGNVVITVEHKKITNELLTECSEHINSVKQKNLC